MHRSARVRRSQARRTEICRQARCREGCWYPSGDGSAFCRVLCEGFDSGHSLPRMACFLVPWSSPSSVGISPVLQRRVHSRLVSGHCAWHKFRGFVMLEVLTSPKTRRWCRLSSAVESDNRPRHKSDGLNVPWLRGSDQIPSMTAQWPARCLRPRQVVLNPQLRDMLLH